MKKINYKINVNYLVNDLNIKNSTLKNIYENKRIKLKKG